LSQSPSSSCLRYAASPAPITSAGAGASTCSGSGAGSTDTRWHLLVAHSLPNGHRLFGVRLVVVRNARAGRTAIVAGRLNVCGQISFVQTFGVFAAELAAFPPSFGAGGGAQGAPTGARRDSGAAGAPPQTPSAQPASALSTKPVHGGALGAVKAFNDSSGPNWLRRVLLIVIGISLVGGAAFTLRDLKT
jgi:hypothetical protein